jgi:predicted CxxxxCH...CXXCH cytochrome family protein
MSLTVKRILVIVLAIVFVVALLIVQFREVSKQQPDAPPQVIVSEESQECVSCHGDTDKTPNLVVAWTDSKHAEQGVDCLSCHHVEKGEWDYFLCPGATSPTASHPTPNDCAECHDPEVEQFTRSKHAATAMIFFTKSFDRTVLEPTLTTKHGCQECHEIADQSVGECDACHAKHTFDVGIARNPYTCGECHIGPDHPHIEIWLESKHGNVFTSFTENWEELSYDTDEHEVVPFNAPTCTTCHMDAAPGLEATHDVGSRLAWETQSPYTIRTTEAWGGGLSWEEKRSAMTRTCLQCHSPNFVERYLITGDLSAAQYNEIFREAKRWLNAMNDAGIIFTPGFEGLAPFTVAGYDEVPEEESYHIWHHEGRRYRHGALMMGADYTQWHGIWDLQHDLIEIIRYGAEHGLPEAEAWMLSDDAAKFWLYPFFDIPGSAWGIDTLAYRKSDEYTTQILMNRDVMPDYWDRAYANVEALYNQGVLSDDQWTLYQELWDNRDVENGQVYPLPPDIEVHLNGLARDNKATTEQVVELELPFGGAWEWAEGEASGK